MKWEDVNSSALVLLSVTFIPQKTTPLRHQGSGERQPYWQEEGGVSWEVITYGKQGGPSLLRRSIGPSLGLCSLRSNLQTVLYQTKLCCILREKETRLRPCCPPETLLRSGGLKERKRETIVKAGETVMRTGAAWSQTEGRKRKRMGSCMITPQYHTASHHPGGGWR